MARFTYPTSSQREPIAHRRLTVFASSSSASSLPFFLPLFFVAKETTTRTLLQHPSNSQSYISSLQCKTISTRSSRPILGLELGWLRGWSHLRYVRCGGRKGPQWLACLPTQADGILSQHNPFLYLQGAGAWYYFENRDNGQTFDKADMKDWNDKKRASFEKPKQQES